MRLGPTCGPNVSCLRTVKDHDLVMLLLILLVTRLQQTRARPQLALRPHGDYRCRTSLLDRRLHSPGTAGTGRMVVSVLHCHLCLQGSELLPMRKIGTKTTLTTSPGDMARGSLSPSTGSGPASNGLTRCRLAMRWSTPRRTVSWQLPFSCLLVWCLTLTRLQGAPRCSREATSLLQLRSDWLPFLALSCVLAPAHLFLRFSEDFVFSTALELKAGSACPATTGNTTVLSGCGPT
mmetsp:Transcript_21150/g.50310  ORF Transcript_21150/g.50310 Transcript_21150/m.50310 type:complete len:235 (-) Transcript_21150:771-1475(-)